MTSVPDEEYSSVSLFGDEPRYSVKQQLAIWAKCRQSTQSNPFVMAHLNLSHTDCEDFLDFAYRGVSVFYTNSGLTLHNLAARSAINTVATRPLLYWAAAVDQSQEYLLGEEIEAAATGSDGIAYSSNDLLRGVPTSSNPQLSPSDRIKRCNDQGILVIVKLDALEHLDNLIALENKPNVVVTFEQDVVITSEVGAALDKAGIFHVSAYRISDDTPSLGHIKPGSAVVIQNSQLLPSLKEPHVSLHYDALVKVCGIKTVEAAEKALESGADMIGMIMVPGRSRTVDIADAKRISDAVHGWKARVISPTKSSPFPATSSLLSRPRTNIGNNKASGSSSSFGSAGSNGSETLPPFPSVCPTEPSSLSVFDINSRILRAKARRSPLLVGVFQDQPLDYILSMQQELSLDLVQLHGSEPLEWCRMIPVPVIKRFTPNTGSFSGSSLVGLHYISLLDGEIGGEGKLVDWSAIKQSVKQGARFILAGGLTEHNVAQALQTEGVFGVDVSGGVETKGVKDLGKIERFVKAAKSCRPLA